MTSSATDDGVPAALAQKLAGLKVRKNRAGDIANLGLQDRDLRSLQPYELSDSLRPVVERLGLQQNIVDMQEQGYTVLKDCFSHEECERLVEAARRVGCTNHMLRKGGEEIFDSLVVFDKMYAMAEYMVGQGCQLSQLAATLLPQNKAHVGLPRTGLHADQNWTPAPFPEHNQLFTCCVVASDDFTLENGATCVCPGSHKLRRHPNQAEQQHCAELVEPILAQRGDVACWDGSIWHAPGVRSSPGERVVFHVTYSRIFMTPLENYSAIPDSTIDSRPYAQRLRRLIGRGPEMEGIFNLEAPNRDLMQFFRVTEMARGTYNQPAFDERLTSVKKYLSKVAKLANKQPPTTALSKL